MLTFLFVQGGQAQRVMLCVCAALQPDVLLLGKLLLSAILFALGVRALEDHLDKEPAFASMPRERAPFTC